VTIRADCIRGPLNLALRGLGGGRTFTCFPLISAVDGHGWTNGTTASYPRPTPAPLLFGARLRLVLAHFEIRKETTVWFGVLSAIREFICINRAEQKPDGKRSSVLMLVPSFRGGSSLPALVACLWFVFPARGKEKGTPGLTQACTPGYALARCAGSNCHSAGRMFCSVLSTSERFFTAGRFLFHACLCSLLVPLRVGTI